MKPSRHGINLHRPLGPDELKRRFRRIRATLPPVSEADDGSREPSDFETDEHWDPWCFDRIRFGEWKIGRTWCELLEGSGVTVAERVPNVDWTAVPVVGAGEMARRILEPRRPWPAEELPSMLFASLNELSATGDVPLSPDSELARRDLSPFRRIAAMHRAVPYYERPSGMAGIVVALYLSPFWVRDPADFAAGPDDLRRAIPDLMEHLFAVHPLARCLRNAWFAEHDGAVPDLRWIAWFILAGQGASVQRAGPLFGWRVARPLLQHLPEAPEDLSPTDGFIWADVRRLGGNEIELRRLRAHAEYAYSPVYLERNPRLLPDPQPHEFCEFWADTVRWLAKYRAALTDEMCQLILPWAAHLYTLQMHAEEHFSWKGRSPARAHRLAVEYDRALKMPYPDLRWGNKGRDWKCTTQEGGAWSMRELVSAKELYEEGEAMSHCVASYAMRCHQGNSVIFSLRRAGRRRLTVELNPDDFSLVQIRGAHNRAPTPQELALLQEWQARLLPNPTRQE